MSGIATMRKSHFVLGSCKGYRGAPAIFFIGICLLGLALSDNSTIDDSIIDDVSEVTNTGNNLDADTGEQSVTWGEWSPWSKWSACSRSCGGGISRQQRRCRRKPCKGRPWSTKYKVCNPEPCEKPSDIRAEQCAAYDDVPYSGQLLKWYPHYDPTRPCALICRGEQSLENTGSRLKQETSAEKTLPRDATEALQLDSDETIVVQLADKVEDGTKCYTDGTDVCIAGQCMKVGCDLRVGSNKNTDACGVCGGNGSSCQSRYSWSLESISACSKSCGGGFKLAVVVCKSMPDETVVDNSYCDPDSRPETTRMPCNTHLCTAKWVTGEWSICSASCGGGSRTRAIFCTEENGNETTKLPDHKCSGMHKPRNQETCNTISCPMWETNKWSECSVTCGTGIKTRTVECRDAVGSISTDCDPVERPHTEQECKTNIVCPIYADEMTQPLMQPYPPPPVSEKLIDQPIPSESTFIADDWSPCSVTCGEGIRHRDVKCKIFLEFSRTIANLPDRQCSGPKPIQTEKCMMEPCGMIENNLSFGIDAVGDSGYAEPSLTDDSYNRPSGGSSGGSGYDSGIKVAPGSDVETTYSWKEAGYTSCSATCLGGVQDLIINCVRDDTGKTVIPLLCSRETKPEARIRVCNDHPCPPRWNLSEFSPCMSPCGLGIQTRDVTCIHEVTRGSTGKTVPVPNKMCPQPPPADRQYCNVWDCPVKWSVGKWGKCSKTCGGGVMKRKVTCDQIMAQGRQQSREDRECTSQKPASERPCNNRACHDMDAGSLPIISSQNTTYNQTDLNAKVDLKIGGTAKIFQGTPFIKIRCPVRKFDKSQIIWTKDNKELRKSRKHKISKKGALKINDITASDSGIYACIAGNSHAETQLIVKFRSKEQISSEEYLRLSNSVYLQRNANLDSAPANSGETLYTDRTAAYANHHFIPIDSEDLSHERAFPSNPTKKPQRKQKTSPTPPDSTDLHKEQTVTSQNQPGYHESVESIASSASTLVPHLTYFISSLKEYWPFQSESSAGRSHRTAPVAFIDSTRKEAGPTKRTMADRTSGLRYQNVEENLDTLYRNTAIPDETFGPDEERIFIDVDPYDLDDSMFGLQHSDPVKITPVASKQTPVTSAISDKDYVEESLKNVKRQWQDKGHGNTTPKEQAKDLISSTTSDGIGLEVFYIPDSSTRHAESQREETDRHHDSTEIEHVFSTMSLKELEESQRKPDSRDKGILNRTENYAEELEEGMKKRKTYVENDTVDDSLIWTSTRDPEEDLSELTLHGDRGSIEKEQEEKSGPVEIRNDSGEETNLEDSEEKKNKSLNIAGAPGRNTTTDASLATLSILDTSEEQVFEWVTTEWSKCSQTCGGSGFQIRGAQCTVRSAKPSGNSTRTQSRVIIGAKYCEDAGHPMVQKVRSCGFGKCPQWHTTEWTPCEKSRCFNWKTAMQRRELTCRLADDDENDQQNVTLLDLSKCDETTRPLQRQECYNDACKGVWKVGEWSECMAPCEKDGMKYRILQCVWFGTKKPAGNACRDIPRPTVMKSCKSAQCPKTPDDCKDHSRLCSRVKSMNMCSVQLYQNQCCQTCQLEKSSETEKPEKSR
ncbi:ADAMTS-like no long nerve cord isoform X2 [Halictus rubicundus]|uniref:ADAMTS-like no long nerve cord isoform X2 n=1 Tax=Halictus rubicundus TaxID=77578 RepID=UPI0040353B61